jgi:hypothetical protein
MYPQIVAGTKTGKRGCDARRSQKGVVLGNGMLLSRNGKMAFWQSVKKEPQSKLESSSENGLPYSREGFL